MCIVLPLWRSNPAVHFARRSPAEETSHLLVNQADNPPAGNDAVGQGNVIVHEASVGIFVGVRDDDIVHLLPDAPDSDRVRIRDDVGTRQSPLCRLDGNYLLQEAARLRLESLLLSLRDVLPRDIQSDSWDPLLHQHIPSMNLGVNC